jgi:hypothetical protein
MAPVGRGIHWPDQRSVVEFGTIELNGLVLDEEAAQRHIIFDPLPRVEGIEPSGDPLLEESFALSGQRPPPCSERVEQQRKDWKSRQTLLFD